MRKIKQSFTEYFLRVLAHHAVLVSPEGKCGCFVLSKYSSLPLRTGIGGRKKSAYAH